MKQIIFLRHAETKMNKEGRFCGIIDTDVIEEGKPEKIKQYVKHHLEPYTGKVKNVVLGCTHYPLITGEIKEVLGNVQFFNGAPYLANHLKEVLQEKDLINDEKQDITIQFIDSSNSEQKKKRFFEILKK